MTQTTSRMSRAARALTLTATLLLGALYFTPLWSVRLVAPQYPEGLGMIIRLNTIEGVKEHDLRNINSLNRYIGMKAIEPDAIPELKYMPWIVGGLIAAGVGVVMAGRRRGLVAWTVAFALLGAAGIYDFWRWSYDYGHNLDVENAIIVVPGMTYQPPLIGTKQLLNFTATSLPHVGGALAGIAFLLVAAAVVASYRRPARIATATLALAAACSSATPTIALGAHACAECRMTIADSRYGALLVTDTGKSIAFDAIDCLLEYLANHQRQTYRATYVADATAGSLTLLPVEDAVFVFDGIRHPPMGSIVAVREGTDARSLRGASGRVLSWTQLRGAPAVESAHAR
jgi:copper chaperone NosL